MNCMRLDAWTKESQRHLDIQVRAVDAELEVNGLMSFRDGLANCGARGGSAAFNEAAQLGTRCLCMRIEA